MRQESIAVFDPEAFYPFRSLVVNELRRASELDSIERFLRAIVLHDKMVMDLAPWPAPPETDEPEWTDEERQAGSRPVIVGIGPSLRGYETLFGQEPFALAPGSTQLSDRLRGLAIEHSGRTVGAHHDAHAEYLGRLSSVLQKGGSVVCDGALGRAAFEGGGSTGPGPLTLFEGLDAGWREYATDIHRGIDLLIPPVLGIVLSRAASRDKLLTVVSDLRDEWAEPRHKVWKLIGSIRTAPTLKVANGARQELVRASKLFSPREPVPGLDPVRWVFDVFAAGIAGAVGTAVFTSSSPLLGGAVGSVGATLKVAAQDLPNATKYWLGSGGVDLARRTRREIGRIENIRVLLDRHLTAAEKVSLGI